MKDSCRLDYDKLQFMNPETSAVKLNRLNRLNKSLLFFFFGLLFFKKKTTKKQAAAEKVDSGE